MYLDPCAPSLCVVFLVATRRLISDRHFVGPYRISVRPHVLRSRVIRYQRHDPPHATTPTSLLPERRNGAISRPASILPVIIHTPDRFSYFRDCHQRSRESGSRLANLRRRILRPGAFRAARPGKRPRPRAPPTQPNPTPTHQPRNSDNHPNPTGNLAAHPGNPFPGKFPGA